MRLKELQVRARSLGYRVRRSQSDRGGVRTKYVSERVWGPPEAAPQRYESLIDAIAYFERVPGWVDTRDDYELPDANGITLRASRRMKRDKLTAPLKIVSDRKVRSAYHSEHCRCMCCGAAQGSIDTYGFVVRCEVHHIKGGRSRSDERCNLLFLCQSCHGTNKILGGPIGLEIAIWIKWRAARHECDWVRLTRLHRRYLPDVDFDLQLVDVYERNVDGK